MADQQTNGVVKNEDAELAALDLSGALAVTGASTLTGAVTAPAGITGDIIGNVVGDVTGTLIGGVQTPIIAVSADGAIAVPSESTIYRITKAGVAAMTLVDPTAVTHDGIMLTFLGATANAHTLDLVTGINGGAADIGTFGGAVGDGVVIVAINGEWFQVPGSNTNVTFA